MDTLGRFRIQTYRLLPQITLLTKLTLLEVNDCYLTSNPVPAGPGSASGTSDGTATGIPWACLPMDFDGPSGPNYSAIKGATALGQIVVAAVGNSDINLDDSRLNGKFTTGHPNFIDSGAIYVGARTPAGNPSTFSTYGSRVDVSAWGDSVWAPIVYCKLPDPTCYNHSAPTYPEYQIYWSAMGGTSAAAPIVAGAIISLQGLQKARGGPLITPDVARDMVRKFGSPQNPGKLVGKMPDIRAMHLWMLGDLDNDGVLNIDEILLGRNPNLDERKALAILLDDE